VNFWDNLYLLYDADIKADGTSDAVVSGKERESSRTPCPFAMLKILSQKTNTFTSEYLLTQPYEKNYFSACPPAVVGQFIF